jgi:hypothetical protein
MKKILIPTLLSASVLVGGCQTVSVGTGEPAKPYVMQKVYPLYAFESEARAIAAGHFGVRPLGLPTEPDLELVTAEVCNTVVVKVRTRDGLLGWIPVESLPERLLQLVYCGVKSRPSSVYGSS